MPGGIMFETTSAKSPLVYLLVGFTGSEFTGLQRYSKEVIQRVPISKHIVSLRPPPVLGASIPLIGGSLLHYLAYPFIVKRNVPPGSLVHITNQTFAHIARIRPDLKSIVTCHDLIPLVHEGKGGLFWEFILKGLAAASRIICISEYTKDCLIKACEEKSIKLSLQNIKVIYQGVDLSHYKPDGPKIPHSILNLPPNSKVMLYVGSEQPRKNFDLVLRLFRRLVPNHPDLYLLKAGRANWPRARLQNRKWLTQNNLLGRVRFLNYVPERLMPSLYRTAEVLVFPSRIEGFGWPPLEAMACGTPVVVSDSASLPEVVGNAAPKLHPDNVEEFREHIEAILMDPELRNRRVKQSIVQANKFDINTTIKQTKVVYDEVLQSEEA